MKVSFNLVFRLSFKLVFKLSFKLLFNLLFGLVFKLSIKLISKLSSKLTFKLSLNLSSPCLYLDSPPDAGPQVTTEQGAPPAPIRAASDHQRRPPDPQPRGHTAAAPGPPLLDR